MRRLLSILLLCLFGLPLVSPLLAQTPESRLPACCRKGGEHHCMGNMPIQDAADQQQPPNPRFGLLTVKCPYTPGALSLHADLSLTPAPSTAHLIALTQPLLTARNTAMRSIAQNRSCPKRGPPQQA